MSVVASEVSCGGGLEDGGEVGCSVVADGRAVGVDLEPGVGVEWEMGVNSGVELRGWVELRGGMEWEVGGVGVEVVMLGTLWSGFHAIKSASMPLMFHVFVREDISNMRTTFRQLSPTAQRCVLTANKLWWA